jgi:hypothetical protein
MTHRFHEALVGYLADHLTTRKVVVWYDTRKEFTAFIAELTAISGSPDRVRIGRLDVALLRPDGPLVGMKLAAERFVAGADPAPTLIYLEGVVRNREHSLLMELEEAGTRWEPKLRSEAQRVLAQEHSDVQIDRLLAPVGLNYADIAVYCAKKGTDQYTTSPLKSIFGVRTSSEALIAVWLSMPDKDSAIISKQAVSELTGLLATRIGLDLDATLPLPKLRHATARFVLLGEFRADYQGTLPGHLEQLPGPRTADHRQHVREIAETMRRRDLSNTLDSTARLGDHYASLADTVQAELRLDQAGLDPAKLGMVDTFRCEEALLLVYAATACSERRYAAALDIVRQRGGSFWTRCVDARAAQWQLAERIAMLGLAVDQVIAGLRKDFSSPTAWIQAYAADQGWQVMDRAHRQLESWFACMSSEPIDELDRALRTARRAYEEAAESLAQGFTKSLVAGHWHIDGILTQRRVLPELVLPGTDRVALFLVDAWRYEMADDLRHLLSDCREVTVRPAVASLPSITPVGMAALLPGAAEDFHVVATKDGVGARIGTTVLAGLKDRQKHLKAVLPDSADIGLDDVLSKPSSQVKQKIKDARLVVVRTTDIDRIGEDGSMLARQVMEQVTANLARAVRKLGKLGITRFVLTADHGHQFATEKGEDARIPAPGGETVDLHRRCWIGRGGVTAPAVLRLQARELGYDGDLEFCFPKGTAVFTAGGDLAYHHGGTSLQEMVIPVLTGRSADQAAASTDPSKPEVSFFEAPRAITNRIFRIQCSVQATAFASEHVTLRIVGIADGIEVAKAGMVSNAEQFDIASGVITLRPGIVVDVGLQLTADRSKEIILVALDAQTDAELGRTEAIPVKLGV